MIIKSISVKSNRYSQLIRYILKEDKLMDSTGKLAAERWHVSNIHFSKADMHHLLAERSDAYIRELYEKHGKDGDIQKFISEHLMSKPFAVTDRSKPIILTHNLRNRSIEGYIKEFERNEKNRMNSRKNSVKAYHTILSFGAKDKQHITEAMLKDITKQYISIRGPTSIFLGAVHQDKEHVHIHLIQSGTQLHTGLSNRISREEFKELKRTLQEYQKDKYPELFHSLVEHQQSRTSKSRTRSGTKNISNERSISHKELSEVIQVALTNSASKSEFMTYIQSKGHEVYLRDGRVQGIKYNGDEKFRLSRFGISEKDLDNLERSAHEKKDLKDIKDIRNSQKERSRITDKDKKSAAISHSRLEALEQLKNDEASASQRQAEEIQSEYPWNRHDHAAEPGIDNAEPENEQDSQEDDMEIDDMQDENARTEDESLDMGYEDDSYTMDR